MSHLMYPRASASSPTASRRSSSPRARARSRRLVENNAFLAISVDPPLGLRTKQLTAIDEQGQRALSTLAEAPFGNYGPQATPGIAPGPRAVERRVEGGTIGWLVRGEPRGLSLEEAGIDTSFFLRMGTIRFARALTPDPARNWRVALAIVDVPPGRMPAWSPLRGEVLCDIGLGGNLGGGGCSPLADWLARGPFNYGTGGSGGEQYVFVSGVASDDVERMELYLATGERVPVALRDNVFVAEVARTKFPARLVAYDREGRIIATENMSHDPLADPGPRPIEGKQRVVKRVVGASGTRGVLRVGPSTTGTRCYRVSFEGGAGGGGCLPKGFEEPLSLGVSDAGSDSFVSGTVARGTTAVELRFRDGEQVTVEVTEGAVLHALTRAQAASGGPELAIALDTAGNELGRQRFKRPQTR